MRTWEANEGIITVAPGESGSSISRRRFFLSDFMDMFGKGKTIFLINKNKIVCQVHRRLSYEL